MNQPDYRMRLDELLPELAAGASWCAQEVTGLTNDSRRVQPGDLFLACRGERFDGAAFIDAAVAAGAVAVVTDGGAGGEVGVPVMVQPDLAVHQAELAARFYRQPGDELDLIAITGTNGKTSCCHFIAQALAAMGEAPALIGTNGYGFYGQLESASHTTPDAIRLQQLLAGLRDRGARQVVMEVSSHALEQQRVAGLRFSQAVFTNLSRDHLDYHGTMEAYGAAKARLFHEYGVTRAVVNRDDPFGRTLLAGLGDEVQSISYGLDNPGEDGLSVEGFSQTASGIAAVIRYGEQRCTLESALIGRFNLLNLLAAAGVLLGRGHALAAVVEQLAQLQGVAGRMESFHQPHRPLVVVDYAHTPDALEKALQALRGHCQGQLWCVFGCGGDRDRGKRPQMAAVAEAAADRLVITSDNPRSEEPQAIIEDISAGLKRSGRVVVEADRSRAITYAVTHAEAGDVVLVAGKGHEDYQEISGVRYPFSDADQVRQALGGAA
ncbi:UDP-N-acetylmuramoyl-L-alanyl-D-glutamate--2,6-diaminopimelate ligase [Motiliproteus sediminis]|uniref:UDP-N-acetylmuramoyl-L-alanyl-D-glutamate--2, 6-diaminopimelate ligase n=1 Tax=Motiliproteus sediminis TaxID=1468178 RepID=UPI001FEA831F|nr:UDP-N-acetylmuramoyl-L-alanyl-D-glutamate--2,6-diaminopimelate ligase [Motiliproteus sediminis]